MNINSGKLLPHSRYRQQTNLGITNKQVNPPRSFGGAAVWLSGITLCVTFLSITFYGAGKAYRVAYLHQFGVNDSMLPWSTQDLIYLGATKKLTTILWAFPALVGFLSAMILFMWGSYRTGKYVERRFASKAYVKKIEIQI